MVLPNPAPDHQVHLFCLCSSFYGEYFSYENDWVFVCFLVTVYVIYSYFEAYLDNKVAFKNIGKFIYIVALGTSGLHLFLSIPYFSSFKGQAKSIF